MQKRVEQILLGTPMGPMRLLKGKEMRLPYALFIVPRIPPITPK